MVNIKGLPKRSFGENMHLALICKVYFVVIVGGFFFFIRFCGQLSMSVNLLYVICIHVIFRPVIDVFVNFTIAFGDYYI